jgi:peptidoglycan/xylan/chitin deacetylase (PgdA/CDA1 family)
VLVVQTLALTFDDGSDPDGTPLMLDVLARADARATFFVIAPRAAAHPDLMARMIADGHTVGLHCDDHVRHSERDTHWCATDTRRALQRLLELGIFPALWRTPWGDTAPWTERIAAEHDLRIVGWTVDTHDWRGDGAEQMYDATRNELRDGAIVLAHDGVGPGATRRHVAETEAYVGRVAEHGRRHGLKLAALV